MLNGKLMNTSRYKLTRVAGRSESGAVLVEACIGLSLMVFAWILMSYSSYLGTNHIRTAMAARHAAWKQGMMGSDGSPTVEEIEREFFYETGLTRLELRKAPGLGSLVTGNSHGSKMANAGDGPYIASVTYGPEDLDSTTVFPFNMMKVTVPFAGPTRLSIFEVKTECQWEEIGDTWDSLASAAAGLLSTVTSLIPKP